MLTARLARVATFTTLPKLFIIGPPSQWFSSHKCINLAEPAVQRYLDYLILENEKLLIKDERTFSEIKRLRELKSVASVLTQRMSLQRSIASLKDNWKNEEDFELVRMMREEYEIYLQRAIEVDNQLQSVLLEPVLSDSEILLEIVAAEGDDAAMFVKELFNMYRSYITYKNWKAEVGSVQEAEKGYQRVSLLIKGFGAFEMMNLESGVHHRISKDDRLNRICTVSVSVLLQPNKSEIDIPKSELTVEYKEDNENPNDNNDLRNCVCITHIPTKTSVRCKEFKSNKLNEYVAMKELTTVLFHKQNDKSSTKQPKDDGVLIQSDRIIRTYDYSRDRVMEHRDGEDKHHHLTGFMEGGNLLERLQQDLLSRHRYQALMNDIDKFKQKHKTEREGEASSNST